MRTGILTLAAFAALTPAAHAATVTAAPDGTIVVTAAPGETNRLGFQASAAEDGRLTVHDSGAPLAGAGSACDTIDENTVVCDWAPVTGARADLGDGDDWGYVSFDLPAAARFALSGGAGNDHLQADVQPTTLEGGAGDDRLEGGSGADTLAGGDGNDTLEGRGGGDRLDGGTGDDLLSGDGNRSPAADVIDGGPGLDAVESDWQDSADDARPQPVGVTLAGGADDGRPGEGDDVRSIERIVSHASGRLTGTDAPEDLELFQVSTASAIDGGGGNDALVAGDGADSVDGGAGDDDIDAGFGDDTVTGGPGRDTISADRRSGDCGPAWCKLPYGNDVVRARDGERDSIDCGAGEDTVYADPIDVVAASCEHVVRNGDGGGPAAPGAPAGPAGSGPPATGLQASVRRARLGRALAHGLTVRVTAPGDGRVDATATMRGNRVATGHRSGSGSVTLRFSRAASARLRHRRSIRLTIVVRYRPATGAATGRRLTTTVER